jgi:hypothetical protein
MPKLNFDKLNLDQAASIKRDVGGLTSKSVLMIANGACLVWALLIISSYRH